LSCSGRAAGVVSAGGVAFDDEAVTCPLAFWPKPWRGSPRRQYEELRTFHRRELAFAEGARVKRGKEFLAGNAPMTSIFS